MKYGTYMFLIALKPPPPTPDSNCVLESLSRTYRPYFYRDPDDSLQAHIVRGLGVQCKFELNFSRFREMAAIFS